MAKNFHLSVVAPDRSVVETEVSSVIAPGIEGYFGILAGHVPIVAALRPGLLEFQAGPERQYVAIGGGFLEMSGDKVTVLADSAERAEEIDVAKAQEMLALARAALSGKNADMTSEEAQRVIEMATQRLKAAKVNLN